MNTETTETGTFTAFDENQVMQQNVPFEYTRHADGSDNAHEQAEAECERRGWILFMTNTRRTLAY